MTLTFNKYISAFQQEDLYQTLSKIGRGIEREALRVLPEGKLSQAPHYKSLGSALTHDNITTDYAESLLEFITPVSQNAQETLDQLTDIQKFTLSQIDGELLWPLSMPCFVSDESKVQLAYYGESNIGRMKTTYRQGLKNRYGSMMQVIAGIHFNFSFPIAFWQAKQTIDNDRQPIGDYVSAQYFSMIRNYKRFCWLIPYLYGSSPALCPSFLQGKHTELPFKKSAKGYMYLEYATSLRMSDLGYTNSEQSSLHICYNDLSGYIEGVKEAINIKSERFEKIGVKVNGHYNQLNVNVLQIENELYAPIRPKQVAQSGEKPSEALLKRGVEYIEVRALDVNPFSETGISLQQVHFLDIFLTFCALHESNTLNAEQQSVCESNMNEVVVRGRDPQLLLDDNGIAKSVINWGEELFEQMHQVALLLDKSYGDKRYQEALALELAKIRNPDLTPSAKILNTLVKDKQSMTQLALTSAVEYREQLLSQPYKFFDENYFISAGEASHRAQKLIESSDVLSYDEFLENYFAPEASSLD